MERVGLRNLLLKDSGKLDEKYIIKWAKALSEDAQDFRIYKEVKRLLKL